MMWRPYKTGPRYTRSVSSVPKSFRTEHTGFLRGLCVKFLSATEDTEKILAAE